MPDVQDPLEPIDVLLEEVMREPGAALVAQARRENLWRRVAAAAVVLLGVGAVIGAMVWRRDPAAARAPAASPQDPQPPPQSEPTEVHPKGVDDLRQLLGDVTAVRLRRQGISTMTPHVIQFVTDPDVSLRVDGAAAVEWRDGLLEILDEQQRLTTSGDMLQMTLVLKGNRQITATVALDPERRVMFVGDPAGELVPFVLGGRLSELCTAADQELLRLRRFRDGAPENLEELDQLPAAQTRLRVQALQAEQVREHLARFTHLELLAFVNDREKNLPDGPALADVAALPNLRSLRSLSFSAAALTDDDLAPLQTLPQLAALELRDSDRDRFTGTGLAALRGLRSLTLVDCPLADQGWAVLPRLPELEELHVNAGRSGAPKALLVLLPSLPKLRRLGLRGTGYDGKSIEPVLRTRVTELTLAGTACEGGDIGWLRDLPSLRVLDLTSARIGDDDVDALAKLTSLRRLVVWETNLSADGLRRLRAALPECAVEGEAGVRRLGGLAR